MNCEGPGFDSHAHLDAFAEDGSLADVLARAHAAGVLRTVAIGGSVSANQRAVDLARLYPRHLRATVGFDRDEAVGQPDWLAAEALLSDPHVVAVGETGLDYHYAPETAPAQRALFQANLERAARFRRPVVVHTREADEDTVHLLKDFARDWPGPADRVGVIHCFTGSAALATHLLDLGFYLSFSGIVTFKNAADLREVARRVPADRLLIETDAPFLAPVPYRGKRNEPAWVMEVAAALATVRNDTLQELAKQTWVNATHLFGWKEG
jgi:TatD DNase family protein